MWQSIDMRPNITEKVITSRQTIVTRRVSDAELIRNSIMMEISK